MGAPDPLALSPSKGLPPVRRSREKPDPRAPDMGVPIPLPRPSFPRRREPIPPPTPWIPVYTGMTIGGDCGEPPGWCYSVPVELEGIEPSRKG